MSLSKQVEIIEAWKTELQSRVEQHEKKLSDFENKNFELGVKRLIAGYIKNDNAVEVDMNFSIKLSFSH